MELMLFICGVVLLVSALLLGSGYALSASGLGSCDKLSPFECGFSPQDSYQFFFFFSFFLVALVFLVFDLELMILFPYLFSGGGISYWTQDWVWGVYPAISGKG